MSEYEYEVYRVRWRITEWRDGAVYKTEQIDEGWFDGETVKANRPGETDIIYGPVSTDHPMARQMTIRAKRNRK